MKKNIRNFLILIFFLTGIPYLRFLFLRKKGPVVRVIALHDVRETEKDFFVRFLNVVEKRCNVISPNDFTQNNFDEKKLNVLFTFDDGYESWEKVVAPEFEKRDWGGYFFVSSGFVETCGDVEREKKFCREQLLISHRKPISWEGLKRLAENQKNVVGGHTVHHVSLKQLAPEEQYEEIVECKKTIEDALNVHMDSFAYPFGVPGVHYDVRTMEQVSRAGYTNAFTTKIDFVDRRLGNFLIPRTCMEHTDGSLLAAAWLYGAYDMMSRLKGFVA